MPGKHKNPPADDYESADDLEVADTLIGRNVVPNLQAKKKVKKVSAGNKNRSPKRPVTPGCKRRRPQSAPSGRSGHDLWMNAVKNRQIVGLASSRHAQSPRHKTASEYWMDTLRKTGSGFTTESIGMNTFNGRRPRDQDMAYLSTPSYLRQLAGTERPGKMADPTVRANSGTPAYKSQEEYYEQILEYKKQVAYMNQEAVAMKAKIRRLEEDNLKKEKEIDSLMNPYKNEELLRTLTDKKPDSGAVIHSLKQKILKLETQMRDKETSYIKLQSDLKTTKIEEMKMQMEVFYKEIVRLQKSKNTGMDESVRGTGSGGSVKIKALNETILRLNKSNEQLQAENRSLKEDLKTVIENTKDGSPRKEYEDMNRNELLRTVSQLKKKLERAEKQFDDSSIVSYDGKANKILGKIALEGSLEERLDQLDKRESELLDIIVKNTDKIKDLTEEKNRWKKRCKEMEHSIDSGTAIDDYDVKSKQARKRPQSASRPPSARSVTSKQDNQTPFSARSHTERPPSAREPPLSSRSEQAIAEKAAKEANARPPSARRRLSIDSGISAVRQKKIQNFKEKRSALIIQKHWRSHNDDKRIQNEKIKHFREDRAARKIQKYWTGYQYKKIEHDQAAEIIQSALLGHRCRQQQIRGYHSDTDSMYDTDDERSQYVRLIQSVLLGHQQRRTTMRNTRISSTTGTEDEDDDNDEDDSDIIENSGRHSYSQRSNHPSSPSPYGIRPSSARSKVSVASSKVSSAHSTSRNRFGVQPLNYSFLDNDDF